LILLHWQVQLYLEAETAQPLDGTSVLCCLIERTKEKKIQGQVVDEPLMVLPVFAVVLSLSTH
jgi:hypothetical protein